MREDWPETETIPEAETFGAYVTGLRKARGKSLRQVCRETGLSPAYLSHIERGKRKPPFHRLIAVLAACYRTPILPLLARAGYPVEEATMVDEWPETVREAIQWWHEAQVELLDARYDGAHERALGLLELKVEKRATWLEWLMQRERMRGW